MGKKDRGKKKNRPPADFKPFEWVLLVFLDATGRGRLGFTFLPSYGLRGWGPGRGCNIHSCPASSPGPLWAARFKPATQSLCAQCDSSLSAGSIQPLILWSYAFQIPFAESQPLCESSSQTSCLPFLTSTWLFTQPNLPTSPETIRVRVWHGPTPSFSRCHLAPHFLWCQFPQSQQMYNASLCLPLHLYSPQQLQASSPWCQAAISALIGEGADDLTLLPISCSRSRAGGFSHLGACTDLRDLTVPMQSPHCLFFNVLYNFWPPKFI